jgi:hypothetical protein
MLRPKEKTPRAKTGEKSRTGFKTWLRKDLKKSLAEDKEILEALD